MRDNDVSKVVWCMFYGASVSMCLHPGYKVNWMDGAEAKKVLDSMASLADAMYDRFSVRFENFKE